MNKMRTLLLVTALVILSGGDLSFAKEIPDPIVNITGLGSYTGGWGRTKWTMQKYAQFIDISYSEPSERFQPPIPKKPLEEPANVNFGRGVCLSAKDIIQMEGFYDSDWENCQYLSIYTKSLNADSKKAVMVYIAGHDLEESSTSDGGPDYLLEEDVVLVIVQFRVGPFGFLSTLTDDIRGNVGILDVMEALRFVKKYIKYFGGDEENITVFGQYKAAAIIHFITMTETFRQEKFFQKMILQSGSALLEGLSTDDPVEIAQQIGEYLQCKEFKDVEPLNECLKAADISELAEAYKKYKDENPRMPYITIGGPSGLMDDPINEVAEYAEFHGVSVMGGVVKHPAVGVGPMKSFMSFELITQEFAEALTESKALDGYEEIIREKFPRVAFKEVFERALLPASVDLNSLDTKEATGKALKYISTSNITTYMYMFNYHGTSHRLPLVENNDEFGTVALGDDNIYLFPGSETLTKNDKKMARIMTKLWTSFAITSHPQAPGYVDNWPEVIKDTMGPYLKIDNIIEIGWNLPEEFFTTILETKQFLESV